MPDSPLLPPVDALIPVVYLLAVVWIGWRVGRGTGDTAQLFLAGRSLRRPLSEVLAAAGGEASSKPEIAAPGSEVSSAAAATKATCLGL